MNSGRAHLSSSRDFRAGEWAPSRRLPAGPNLRSASRPGTSRRRASPARLRSHTKSPGVLCVSRSLRACVMSGSGCAEAARVFVAPKRGGGANEIDVTSLSLGRPARARVRVDQWQHFNLLFARPKIRENNNNSDTRTQTRAHWARKTCRSVGGIGAASRSGVLVVGGQRGRASPRMSRERARATGQSRVRASAEQTVSGLQPRRARARSLAALAKRNPAQDAHTPRGRLQTAV